MQTGLAVGAWSPSWSVQKASMLMVVRSSAVASEVLVCLFDTPRVECGP